LYQHGDPEWFRAGGQDSPAAAAASAAAAAEAKSEPVAIRLAPLAGGRRRGWERARPSGLEGGTTVSLQHLLAPARSAAFARGQLIHAWYEQILWIEDGLPDSAALTAVAQKVLTAEPGANVELAAEMARFQSQLRSPPVAEILSRRRYENLAGAGFSNSVLRQLGTRRLSPRAQNERGFAIRDGDQLLTGFIDRLVLLEDAGQVVAAEIIDFKTDPFDAEDPQQLAAKIAFYAPQMRAYRRAVSQMANCPAERIVASLLFVEAGVVQPVSDPAGG
jgi:ATP-dependent exoDNAse (exonuclease V) beta subunit